MFSVSSFGKGEAKKGKDKKSAEKKYFQQCQPCDSKIKYETAGGTEQHCQKHLNFIRTDMFVDLYHDSLIHHDNQLQARRQYQCENGCQFEKK